MSAPPINRDLKDAITRFVLSARTTAPSGKQLEPRHVSYDSIIRPDGRVAVRKKVILMTRGCSVPTCTMCPFTNENMYGTKEPLDLTDQVRSVFARTENEPPYTVLALYNDGNFFAHREIPPAVQQLVSDLAAASQLEELIVESLPQFITDRTLGDFVGRLGSVHLEVGIGLHSAHSLVRELCVNTSFSNSQFEHAVDLLTSAGATIKTYLAIKPPFLTDSESIRDTVDSIIYLSSLGLRTATLCPTRIAKHTLAYALYSAGLYTAPNLWSVVEILRRSSNAVQLRVACINLRGSDFESIFPDSCPRCADAIIDGLEGFSLTGSLTDIPLHCDCRPSITREDAPIDCDLLVERVQSMLSQLSSST